MSIIVKILWNLLCQYNNIYTSLYKYLKEKKKQIDYWKNNNNNLGTVAIVPVNNCENIVKFVVSV